MGRVDRCVEVNAPMETCYRLWTEFERFPSFMKNVESIRRKGRENVWHWVVKGPMGRNVEWDAEVDAMRPNELISWHSVREADVDTSGAVTFQRLADNRTRIDVSMVYNPPAGAAGEFIADIFKNPEKMVEDDLCNFKALAERTTVGITEGMSETEEILPSEGLG